ncbi:MAG: hypothetical protein APF76_10910 [Desulfitibacter sp. BRH_c19]|nr:MAG: hypothetical protein APF76_10910 [Desulfitibacter sp. BRH_c19]
MGGTDKFFKKKRKWSVIKDSILEWYLTPYIAKILSTHKPVVLVDCFAGMGKFEDGCDGSPLIIAKKIQSVLDEDAYTDIQGVFIEKKYAEDLMGNLKVYANCEVIEGTFEENFENILKPNRNIFLYIDPYGIKSLDFKRFAKLKDSGFYSYEMLMNFNSFGFLREGCRLMKYKYNVECIGFNDDDEGLYEAEKLDTSDGIKLLNSIADGEYWREILTKYHLKQYDMFKAEEIFVNEYIKRLKGKKIFKYTVNIPIKLKTKNIPKYRLIFGTNHHEGLFLMCNNMNKQWKQILNDQRNGQMVLFEYDYPDRSIFGDFDLKKGIVSTLEERGYSLNLIDLYCKVIEKFGIAYSLPDCRASLKGMEDERTIVIIRNPSKTRTGRVATGFDYTKYKIEVRRIQ